MNKYLFAVSCIACFLVGINTGYFSGTTSTLEKEKPTVSEINIGNFSGTIHEQDNLEILKKLTPIYDEDFDYDTYICEVMKRNEEGTREVLKEMGSTDEYIDENYSEYVGKDCTIP
jgi:hypothetical protein